MKKILQCTLLFSVLLSCQQPYDPVDNEFTVSSSTSAALSSTITFAKNYGGAGFDENANAVIRTYDGGYAMVGLFLGPEAFYLVKADQYGTMQWQKTLGENLGDGNGGRDIRQTPDSGFIMIGNAEVYPIVIKTDKAGNLQWEWHGSWFSQGTSIALTSDGYVGVGYNYDSITTINVFKLSTSGNLIWTRTYTPGNGGSANSIERTSDKGFIIAGTAWTSKTESQDICLLKIDSQGNLQWQTFWGSVYGDEGKHAIQSSDGGYAVIGSKGKERNSQIYLIKTNFQGRYQWIKGYFPSVGAGGNSIVQTSDNGYAIAANAYSRPNLIKVSSNGSFQWRKTFNDTILRSAPDVITTTDGGYAITGLFYYPPTGLGFQAALVKTDRYGNF